MSVEPIYSCVNDLRPSVFSPNCIQIFDTSPIRNYQCIYYLPLWPLRSWSGNGDWKYMYSNLECWWDSCFAVIRELPAGATASAIAACSRARTATRRNAARSLTTGVVLSLGFPFEYVSFLSKSKLVVDSFPAVASMLPHTAVLQSTARSPPACSGIDGATQSRCGLVPVGTHHTREHTCTCKQTQTRTFARTCAGR